jgi:hypothetical protein
MRCSFKRPGSYSSILAAVLTGHRLMKEASINAKQSGERGISAKNVKKVTEVRLF